MIATLESSAPVPPAAPAVANARPSRVEELVQTVSASRLGLWQTCRLKFYYRYVLGLIKPSSPSRHVGKVVHATLQAWSKARWRKEPFNLEKLKGAFEADWKEQQVKEEPIDWEGEEEKQRLGAWGLVGLYFAQTPIPAHEKPEAVEVSVEADLARHGLPALRGILDLVRPPGRIVDFKTSAQSPNPESAVHLHEVQTSAYAVLYREATGNRESGIELHHLVKTKQPKLVVTQVGPMSEAQKSRLFRCMESYVEGVRRRDFVPSPGFHCCACEYFPQCRRWDGKEARG